MKEVHYLWIERPVYEWREVLAENKQDAITKGQQLVPNGVIHKTQTEKPED
jgi:hypothetical protein